MVNKGFIFDIGLDANLIRAFHAPLRQILPNFDVLKRRLHPLHRAVADAATARRLRDADASSQQLADALLDRVADLGPFELLPLLHGSPLPAALVDRGGR